MQLQLLIVQTISGSTFELSGRLWFWSVILRNQRITWNTSKNEGSYTRGSASSERYYSISNKPCISLVSSKVNYARNFWAAWTFSIVNGTGFTSFDSSEDRVNFGPNEQNYPCISYPSPQWHSPETYGFQINKNRLCHSIHCFVWSSDWCIKLKVSACETKPRCQTDLRKFLAQKNLILSKECSLSHVIQLPLVSLHSIHLYKSYHRKLNPRKQPLHLSAKISPALVECALKFQMFL